MVRVCVWGVLTVVVVFVVVVVAIVVCVTVAGCVMFCKLMLVGGCLLLVVGC